jgi:DNA modification methylase
MLPLLPEAFADLVYFDPPFGTGRVFPGYDDRPRELSRHRETEIEPRTLPMLDLAPDADSRAWLDFFASCLGPIRRAAKPTATLWIHLNEERAHIARLLCDVLLAPARWRSTVVWSYRRWPAPAKRFQSTHDVLFVYAPDGGTFNVLRGEPSPSTLKTWGRRKQNAVFRDGERVRSEATDEPSPGPPLGDVWEIPIVAPSGHERERGSGFSTQKPEALLRRIVESTSNPGDLVLDPACGSGTALAAAHDLSRRWLGIDVGEQAIRASARRLGVEAESSDA